MAAVWVASACDGSTAAPGWSARDSSGVQIVTSEPATATWALAPEPRLTLGSIDEGGAAQFFRIQDIELLPDSSIAVANRGSEEIRIFDASGRHMRSFGGSGRGPEEFVRLEMVEEGRDSLFTYDNGNDRLQVRDLSGGFGRTFRLEWFYGALFPVHVAPDGAVLAVTGRYMTELSGTGRVVDTALVSLYDPTGALVDSFVRLPHNERFVKQVGDMRTTIGAPFSASASLVGTPDGFCYAFGPSPEIRCHDRSGGLRAINRVLDAPSAVTEADIGAFWAMELEADTPYRPYLVRLRSDITFPEFFPAISQLTLDDTGRIWAKRFVASIHPDSDESWWIFEGGHLVGSLTTPQGFRVLDIEGGLIAGVWTDELGVEFVRVYELMNSGTDSTLANLVRPNGH